MSIHPRPQSITLTSPEWCPLVDVALVAGKVDGGVEVPTCHVVISMGGEVDEWTNDHYRREKNRYLNFFTMHANENMKLTYRRHCSETLK